MQITNSFVVAVLGTLLVASHVSAESQLKFLQHGLHASKISFNGHAEGSDQEDATDLLIPRMSLAERGVSYVVDSPEGGVSPFVPQHAVKWSEKSEVPKWAQFLLGGAWVFMLASIPFIIPIIDKKTVTKTHMTVGSLMLVVVLGGFYLFTNIILFQSIHFDKIRPLTIVECIYFMAQVITTVGYGDITPAKIRGQVFVGMYVLGALFIIAMLVSDLTNHMVEMGAKYKAERAAARGQAEERRTKTLSTLITPEKPSPAALLQALAVFAALDICWVMFFSLHPGEGKTVFQALYMSVITLSSVGFGYFTPVTEAGMIFGAFWMLFGCGALVSVISNFTELMMKLNEWENFRPESKTAAMDMLKGLTKSQDEVTEVEFLKFGLLQLKCVSKDDLVCIQEAFANLNPTKNGTINLKVIQEHLTTPDADAPASKAS